MYSLFMSRKLTDVLDHEEANLNYNQITGLTPNLQFSHSVLNEHPSYPWLLSSN